MQSGCLAMDSIVFGDDLVHRVGKDCGQQVIINPIVRPWSADTDGSLLYLAYGRRIGQQPVLRKKLFAQRTPIGIRVVGQVLPDQGVTVDLLP